MPFLNGVTTKSPTFGLCFLTRGVQYFVLFLFLYVYAWLETRKLFGGGNIETVTSVGAVHSSTADLAIFVPFPGVVGLAPKNGDPEALLSAQSDASCAFLTGQWPSFKTQLARGSDGGNSGLALREPIGGPSRS